MIPTYVGVAVLLSLFFAIDTYQVRGLPRERAVVVTMTPSEATCGRGVSAYDITFRVEAPGGASELLTDRDACAPVAVGEEVAVVRLSEGDDAEIRVDAPRSYPAAIGLAMLGAALAVVMMIVASIVSTLVIALFGRVGVVWPSVDPPQ